ncbi:MAG: J domain-containing protein [Armatimonadota bacterium]
MPAEKDYYKVLGVPRDATPEQIKRRYRELVRKYHPDVNPDKAASHQRFVAISEAYRVLSDPGLRAAHNLDLERREARQREQQARQQASTRSTSTPFTQAQQHQPPVERMMANAVRLMSQRRYADAAGLCRQIIARDRTNARAYSLLGDIYATLGRTEDAIVMYTYAQQYAPNDTEVLRKLNRLLAAEVRHSQRVARRIEVLSQVPALLMTAGWVTAAILYFLSFQSTAPLSWISILSNVPSGAFLLLLADSALAGLLLATGNALGRFDDEMLFPSTRRVLYPGPPIGLFIPLAAILCFWVAVVFYAIYAWLQEHVSVSVLKAFAICFVMVCLFVLPHPEAASQLLLWGIGPAFCTFCFGWMVADSFRSNWMPS